MDPLHIGLAWSPDGRSVVYDQGGETQNLWRMSVDGGAPEQLTQFESGQIWYFAPLPDGGFAVSRGPRTRDVVLLENFR